MTIVLVAAVGATGLVLVLGGLPLTTRRQLARRVDPYLGRPDVGGNRGGLLLHGARMMMTIHLGSSDRDVAARLRAARVDVDPPAFRVQQLVWGAGGFAAVVALVVIGRALGMALEPRGLLALGGLSSLCGVLGRDWFLTRQVDARAERMNQEMPLAIDLMTLTLMAGGSVPTACERVATALPEGVGRELRDALDEMKGGRSATAALKNVANEVRHPALERLIDALRTGMERGTPLADVLRAQAHDMRDEHRRRLIETGGRREIAMLVPVVFLILPTVVLFALFPALASLDLLVP